MAEEKENTDSDKSDSVNQVKTCGIIMPISDTEGYPNNHWTEVLEIIEDALLDTGFKARLVSNSDTIRIIHESIVTNIFSDELVICDVSSRNPNVMFELGLRLAFDKPVIIIKDKETPYSFDTSPIQHIPYPSSLRFGEIVEFKKRLKEKVIATYGHFSKNPSDSPFLKNFRACWEIERHW